MIDAFAATCEAIAATSSRLEKVRLASAWLATLSDEDIGIGACFLSGLPFPRADSRRLQVGGAMLVNAAVELSGYDGHVVGACARACGDLGEAIGLLSYGFATNEDASLAEARKCIDDLSRSRVTARRLEILVAFLKRLSPRGVKYFVKVLSGGMRIGLLEKQVEEAIADACGAPKEAVRAANVRSGDIEAVAKAARAGTLAEVKANLFHPIDFMLASPVLATTEVEDPASYLAERKLDGIRAQAHVGGGRVVLFSRGLGDVTAAFPEVVAGLRGVRGPVVLDGELLAMDGDRALPFLLLQRRLSRKNPSEELRREIAVNFVAYDILHDPSGLLFDLPLEERQSRLAALVNELGEPSVRLSRVMEADSHEALDQLFDEARIAGDEGLVLKRRGSLYEPGRRGDAWIKLKRALGTLDVVITAAEQGHGKRSSLLSDYTFAVRDGDQFANVGKAFTGLTDAEIRSMTKRLQAATLERFGRVRLVRPEIVLEVAFDTVQKSARHKSGFALRFPRIVRIRDDKLPSEIDTIDRVRELYEAAINTGRVATTAPPPVRQVGAVDDLPLFRKRGDGA